MNVSCLMREEIVGWNHGTLVRLLWDGDVLDIEVGPNEPTASSRNRIRNSWMSLRGRPGAEGFDLTSVSDYGRFGNALEALIPVERPGSIDGPTPSGVASRWFVSTPCTEGCVLSVRAYAGDEDEPGWISVDLISNARTRRDGALSARLANALRASLGHEGGAPWCPLATPIELLAALASASCVAFPNRPGRSEHPALSDPEKNDNGKDGNG